MAKFTRRVVLIIAVCAVLCLAWLLLKPRPAVLDDRPRASEAQINLRRLLAEEQRLFESTGRYVETLERPIESGHRYTYFLSTSSTLDGSSGRDALPTEMTADLGVHGTCPASCWMTIAAVANLDGDDTLDVWSISTHERIIGGTTSDPGEPFRHVDDDQN